MAMKASETDWRKGKRGHGGSVYEYGGKMYARIQYVDEDGKRKDKKVRLESKNGSKPTRSEARKQFQALRAKFEKYGQAAVEAHDMTFEELAVTYKKTKLVAAIIQKGKKITGLRSHRAPLGFLETLVKHFGRRKKLRMITHADIEAFRLERLQTPALVCTGKDEEGRPTYKEKGERSIAGINRELALLRAMLAYAKRQGWIAKSPFEHGGLIMISAETERTRVLTLTEQARLLACCTGRRKHLKPLLIVALDAGMRHGEMMKLEWKDVDLEGRMIHVNVTNTKAEKSRDVGMTPRVHAALQVLKQQVPPGYTGRVFGVASVKNSFQSALREAEIEGFRFHDLRHSAITNMVRSGLPHAEIMKTTGHTQFKTFLRYVNDNKETARQNADRLAAWYDSQTDSTSESEAVN